MNRPGFDGGSDPWRGWSHASPEEVPAKSCVSACRADGVRDPRADRRSSPARSPGSPTSSASTARRCATGSRQAEVDAGQRPGVPTAERQRIAELEREVRELRRANEILKAASAFFAAELDRPRTR